MGTSGLGNAVLRGQRLLTGMPIHTKDVPYWRIPLKKSGLKL